jgi:hypothetical protein
MNEERQALSAFLCLKQFRYCNMAGVTFYRMANGSLCVAARYPGVEETAETSLDCYQYFDQLTEFMTLLRISDPECLHDVVPEDLIMLYERELLDIICTLKGKRVREMRFRKIGGMLWAINTRKRMHLVRTPIHQPEDFIAYTMRYYKVIDR